MKKTIKKEPIKNKEIINESSNDESQVMAKKEVTIDDIIKRLDSIDKRVQKLEAESKPKKSNTEVVKTKKTDIFKLEGAPNMNI